MAIHSSSLAWRILWTEEPGRPQSIRVAKSQTRLSNWACNASKSAQPLPWMVTSHYCLVILQSKAICPLSQSKTLSLSSEAVHYNTISYLLFLKIYRRVREPWRTVAQHIAPWPWGIFCMRCRRQKCSSSHLLCIIVMLAQSTSKC